MLIHMDEFVYRFECLERAKDFAIRVCRGSYNFYIIVDTEENVVVESWSY